MEFKPIKTLVDLRSGDFIAYLHKDKIEEFSKPPCPYLLPSELKRGGFRQLYFKFINIRYGTFLCTTPIETETGKTHIGGFSIGGKVEEELGPMVLLRKAKNHIEAFATPEVIDDIRKHGGMPELLRTISQHAKNIEKLKSIPTLHPEQLNDEALKILNELMD